MHLGQLFAPSPAKLFGRLLFAKSGLFHQQTILHFFMVLTIAPPFPVPSSRLAGERPQFVAGKSAVNHMQVQFGPVLVGFIAR